MEEHYNGVSSTEELEAHLQEHGVLFQEFRGKGFLVVNDKTVFVVKDHENRDFQFSELSAEHIHEVTTEESYPTHRIERREDAEKTSETNKPCTEVKIWMSSHTIQFYVDAPPHQVSTAFVNFRLDDIDI